MGARGAGPGLARAAAAGLGLVLAASAAGELLRARVAPTNLVMPYLIAVVLAAIHLGLGSAIAVSALSVLAFDVFFVPPRFSLTVADTEYFITFLGLFTVGVVISTLVARVREGADAVREREAQTASLLALSRDLASAADLDAVAAAVVRNVGEHLGASAVVLLPQGRDLTVRAASPGVVPGGNDLAVAHWTFEHRAPAGRGTATVGSAGMLFLPLATSAAARGVLGVRLAEEAPPPPVRRLLEVFAAQTALAVERAELVAEAEAVRLARERQNLERAFTSSVSHDLRTPLVSILGALGTLREEGGRLGGTARADLAAGAFEEAQRLNRLVGNLLDMTRIEAGAVLPRLEPGDVQELVGVALAAVEGRLAGRRVEVRVPPDLPPARMDMTLLTQVLVNLLDNALKFSPAGGTIEVEARHGGRALEVEVADRGPGVPPGETEAIFEKFHRAGGPGRPGEGTGMGLWICRAFVEAHGGRIRAANRPDGGLAVAFTVPLGG